MANHADLWQGKHVDVDAFVALNEPTWKRLDVLTRQQWLTGAEIDEFVNNYRLTAGHLSTLRTLSPDPELVATLSVLLGSANGKMNTPSQPILARLGTFFGRDLPAVLYRLRWWVCTTAVLWVLGAVVVGAYYSAFPELLLQQGSQAELQKYANEDFVNYYSTYSNASFAGQVWTNNALIATVVVATGILGIVPLSILATNAFAIGQSAAIMHEYADLYIFFTNILPHGLLELTSIFLAGAAGLRLFWVALVPGARSRGAALAAEGRSFMTAIIGLVIMLFISGLIEGFVTPSALPVAIKITIGAVALLAFWLYVLLLGRRAYKRGYTGDLQFTDAGYARPEAG